MAGMPPTGVSVLSTMRHDTGANDTQTRSIGVIKTNESSNDLVSTGKRRVSAGSMSLSASHVSWFQYAGVFMHN